MTKRPYATQRRRETPRERLAYWLLLAATAFVIWCFWVGFFETVKAVSATTHCETKQCLVSKPGGR